MKKRHLYILLQALAAVLAVVCLFPEVLHPGRHARMQAQLARLQAMNRADSLLTDDSLATALASYFDGHGTPREQLLAHYLLGRTHADRGEAPAAIAAYHDAISRADTTARDCDNGLLARVYAQMADVFYRQGLYGDNLNSIDLAIHYAELARDTIIVLNESALKMAVYYDRQEYDTLLSLFNIAAKNFESYNEQTKAAQYAVYAIGALVAKGHYGEAKQYIDLYEKHSGYFDSEGNIADGREIYYYLKGMYYTGICRLDSAENCFRNELRTGLDYNNQNAAAKGLATVYQQKGIPDSVAKYALYSYEMNDSAYAQMVTEEVKRAQGLYNYSRHQQEALRERERANKAESKERALAYVLIFVSVIIAYTASCYSKRRKAERLKHERLLRTLQEAQGELLDLRSQTSVLADIIREKDNDIEERRTELENVSAQKMLLDSKKEADVERLRNDLAEHMRKERSALEGVEERLVSSNTYQTLQKMAAKGKLLTSEEWEAIDRMVLEQIPGFNHFLMDKTHALNTIQYRTCTLLRLHISQASISGMLGVSAPYISKMCKASLATLFGIGGTGKELEEKLSKIS